MPDQNPEAAARNSRDPADGWRCRGGSAARPQKSAPAPRAPRRGPDTRWQALRSPAHDVGLYLHPSALHRLPRSIVPFYLSTTVPRTSLAVTGAPRKLTKFTTLIGRASARGRL